MIFSRNKTQIKWYISNGSQPIYIPKKEKTTVQALALRMYYQYQEQEICFKLKHLKRFLSSCQKCPQKSNQLLSDNSPYKNILLPFFQTDLNSAQWASSVYNQNKKYPEQLIHKCISGHIVRSKSEVIIANALFTNHIPFRYECELILKDVTLYPDFTILHPHTGELYYWEHFGLMDNSSYRDNAFNKLKLYGNNNIFPSINLITTYETSKHPIDSEQIQKTLDEFFL